MRARDKSSSANPLVRYCHFGVSPVNYSDSDSDSDSGSTNGIPISFKVLPMVPLVIPLLPMVPLVKTVVGQSKSESE